MKVLTKMPEEIKSILRTNGVDPAMVQEVEFTWAIDDAAVLNVRMLASAEQVNVTLVREPKL